MRFTILIIFFLQLSVAVFAQAFKQEPAIDFKLPTSKGDSISLSQFRGKVVLLDFWASWCAPCKASFPMLAKLDRELGARGFQVVAIGIDEKPTAAEAFVKKLNPGFPTLHDLGQKLVRRVEVPTMPTSFLLGRDGKVRFIHRGFHGDRTESELRRQIAELLAETNH